MVVSVGNWQVSPVKIDGSSLVVNFWAGCGYVAKLYPVLWSRSWSRKEPKLLAGAGAGAGILKFRLRLPAPAPAPGQTKAVYILIIHIE